MRRFFGRIENNIAFIEGEENVHLKTVLRAKINDKIVVYDKTEFEHICEIVEINKNNVKCKVVSSKVCEGLPKKNIVLFQALTKREAFELSLQKAVELGISTLVPFESDFTNVKSTENKQDRLEKLIISACKQCERSVPMKLDKVHSFSEMVEKIEQFGKLPQSVVLFANERAGEPFDFSCLKDKQNIAIIVGCEGGFADKEKEALEKISASISLGKRILRNETASIVLCGIVSILGEN